jgi:MFS family permease
VDIPRGLGVTQLAAAIAIRQGTGTQLVALLISLWAVAFFICLGIFARKGQKWAFITGMALYAVDALVVLLLQSWVMLLFHGFVFFRLYQGYSSSKELHAFDKPAASGKVPLYS